MASDNENVSSEPDFSDFSDWHVTEQEEEWPSALKEKPLSEHQVSIVERNAALLLNRHAWIKKAKALEVALLKIKDETARMEKRAEFAIHFDCFLFSSRLPPFVDLTFPCAIIFDKATFSDGNILFHKTVFESDISFYKTKISDGLISFFGTVIKKGNIAFIKVELGQTSISFMETTVTGHFFVESVTFPLIAEFERFFVTGTVAFESCIFREVPDFSDSKFNHPPDVSGIEILAFRKIWIWPWWMADHDKGKQFRKLKAMALAANDHEKDGEFFAYEMLAKRGYEAGSTGPIALFINWLYFTFSNFGQSYLRPLIAMFLSCFAFAIYYATQVNSLLKSAEMNDFALGYSFRNVFPFLGSLLGAVFHPADHKSGFEKIFEKLGPKPELIDWLVTVGFVQNAIGAVLLFLLLLGLRNKFRLK